jgi:hypothetical protein
VFSTWNSIIPPKYFKKKKVVDLKIKLISSEEERKKEEKNHKYLKELYNKDEQTIKDMKTVNKERKKKINEMEITLSNKEPKLKPLPKEKSQEEIELEKALHIKKYNYDFQKLEIIYIIKVDYVNYLKNWRRNEEIVIMFVKLIIIFHICSILNIIYVLQ